MSKVARRTEPAGGTPAAGAKKPAAAFLLAPREAAMIYPPRVFEALGDLLDLRMGFVAQEQWRLIKPELADVEILLTGWGTPPLDGELLGALPRLRAVFHGAGSIKGIVTEAFWRREIPITSSAAANAIPVAEYAFAHVVLLLKEVFRYARTVRARRDWVGHWPVAGGYGSTVGLVALGSIGRLVTERLRSLDVRVVAFDPTADPLATRQLGVTLVPLTTVFQESDVVSVHAPLLPETTRLVDERLLRSMKPGAALINTSRGAIIDQEALTTVLAERPDLTAVLDVTWPQPPPRTSRLYDLENVIITPHIAGSMSAECGRMGELVLEEVRRFLCGEPLRHRVPESSLSCSA